MHAIFITMNLVLMAFASVTLVMAGYHFVMTMDNIKPGKRFSVALFGNFPLTRSQLTEDGIYHQKRMVTFILLSLFLGGLSAVLIAVERG